MADDTLTLTISTADDDDTVDVAAEVLDLLAREGETPPEVAGDLVVMSLANRVHHMAHHGQGAVEGDVDLSAIEDTMMDLFEDRFGQTFAEMTGHDH